MLTNRSLTKAQKHIYDYIKNTYFNDGYAPTGVEIAQKFGFKSPNTAYFHVRKLLAKGYLEASEDSGYYPRETEEVVSLAQQIPLAGIIAAGSPIEANETLGEFITLPQNMTKKHDQLFALRVHGDSMKDVDIFDGDVVICEKHETADNGDIVVALLPDNTATLKRFYKQKKTIKLKAENKNYAPIYNQQTKVQGKVVWVIRKFDQNE